MVATHDDDAARKALETRLAAVLADKDNSHMARYALERIQASEVAAALRDALPKVAGALKIGVIGSLGARRDAGGRAVRELPMPLAIATFFTNRS